MPIITFTSDFGNKDHYVASVKGKLLSHVPGLQMVDISHEIAAFNVLEAAFVLGRSYPSFPEGTLHLIEVNPDGSSRVPTVVMLLNGHYFIGPDNGLMSLIKGSQPCESIRMEEAAVDEALHSPAISAVVAIASGKNWQELGAACEVREALWGQPGYSGNALRGTIIYIDHFGNAITNISKPEFLKQKSTRTFRIFLRSLRLRRIVNAYGDVSRGEALARFGTHGLLEIAIREGSAEKLLGLSAQDMLTIEFYDT